MLTFCFRTRTKPLVDGLDKASYQGFPNLAEALDDYLTAKSNGLVTVARKQGDSVNIFGPVDHAEDLLDL